MKDVKICPTCKQQFENKRGKRGQTYCSRSCGLSSVAIVKTLCCENCKQEFQFTGRTKAKFCPGCRKQAASQRAIRSATRSGRINKPGVGRGGNQRGNQNGRFKGKPLRPSRTTVDYRQLGLSHYGENCGMCSKVGVALTVHHRNGDETDHRIENLIPLCYSCHNFVHFIPVPKDQLEQRLQDLLNGRPK